MSKSIYTSISTFSKDFVDLDYRDLDKARSSRKWLVSKIEEFPSMDASFPKLYPGENDVQMGSFRRHTKIRPIDDIDFIIVFNGAGSTYSSNYGDDSLKINVPKSSDRLHLLTNDDSTLNSIKLVNQLKKSLSTVSHYENAEIKRNQEAVTLKLKSYSWNFDIVPAFLTASDVEGRSYYLIPDGSGKWKKTDPRIDSKRVTEVNKKRNGEVLKYIRLIKYWNKRSRTPSIGSYLLENLVLNYFDVHDLSVTNQSTLRDIFNYLSTSIYSTCPDPKQIQGDLNDLDSDTKMKFSDAAKIAYISANKAISYSIEQDQKMAHVEWKKIFGEDFPNYE